MRVLVTGGAGYIGSVVCEELVAAGHAVVALDDLSKGHADAVIAPATLVVANLRDRARLLAVVRDERIDAVVHMAASSLVGESMTNPAEYYATNVEGSLALLDVMRATGVTNLVFSSTAAVYADGSGEMLVEDSPLGPANPYGETKLAVERALGWYARAYGFSSTSLRYFNAAGATARNGERHDPETHLVPRVLEVAHEIRNGRAAAVDLFGDDYPTADGTCIRDYVHVVDLARAHVLALESPPDAGVAKVFNLGGGAGRSVRQVIDAAEKVTGLSLPTRRQPRRPGDPARLVASTARVESELRWRPRASDLVTLVESAWTYRLRRR